ncbi:MAG: DUF3306 domain-containing protein [Hyphomicrobiaceae bacterium]|nr:DUF3306 domain-containing protein [Hyphomicrobiaceae bacterium]
MSKEHEGVLARWSRRKAEARNAPLESPAPEESGQGAPVNDEPHLASRHATTAPSNSPAATHDPAEADLQTLDIDALDASSDYTRFMKKSVPADVRSEALRKLWTSDPVFSLHDGLDDCCGDYTDAQWATGAIATAYRVGKGMLTDEEIAAWERLGRPDDDVAFAQSEGEADVAGEPSEPKGDAVARSATGEPDDTATTAAANAQQVTVETECSDGRSGPKDGDGRNTSSRDSSTPS